MSILMAIILFDYIYLLTEIKSDNIYLKRSFKIINMDNFI